MGVETVASDEALLDRLNEADLFVVVMPEQVERVKRIAKCPLAVMAGFPHVKPSVTLFNEMKINNYLSPSAKHLALLTGSNKLLYPKLILRETLPDPESVEERSRFFSYIHWMDEYWPIASEKMRRLNTISMVTVENFGFGSPSGVVDDLAYMRKAKGTVHLKDQGLTCNAPIRSLALGTPVVMDYDTYNNGYYDNITGITVVNSLDDLANEIEKLDSDIDYLQKKSTGAMEASVQSDYRQEHGDAFIEFLKRVS
jgi:hypothetical protein